MNKQLLDLYSDYLISSFNKTTATGLSLLVDNSVSHDKISRFLAERKYRLFSAVMSESWALIPV